MPIPVLVSARIVLPEDHRARGLVRIADIDRPDWLDRTTGLGQRRRLLLLFCAGQLAVYGRILAVLDTLRGRTPLFAAAVDG
jgi:hypothetical protein